MKQFIPYAKQFISDDDIEEVARSLRSDFITRGPKVHEFEEAVSSYCGVKYALLFSSGTAALHAACYAAQVSSHDRIITSPNTFVATVGAGLRFGASPVFVDIDPSTGNLSIENLHDTLEYSPTRGRAIVIPVHYSGIPLDMQALESGIKSPETIIIEDAAHALGSSYSDGRKVGSCAFSDMTMFSLHPAKTVTSGEGGIITTNNSELFHRLSLFRNNGIVRGDHLLDESPGPWFYEVQAATGNYNVTEFQAALGLSQFRKLDLFAERRRELIRLYRKHLASVPSVKMSPIEYDSTTCYHLCALQINFAALNLSRKDVMEELKRQNIGTQVHYIPLYRHPLFQREETPLEEYFPNMEKFYSRELSFPLFYRLEEEQVAYICEALQNILEGVGKLRQCRS